MFRYHAVMITKNNSGSHIGTRAIEKNIRSHLSESRGIEKTIKKLVTANERDNREYFNLSEFEAKLKNDISDDRVSVIIARAMRPYVATQKVITLSQKLNNERKALKRRMKSRRT